MQNTPPPPLNRIALIDAARGIAVLAMTIFHFSWDLEFFGYAPLGMTSAIGWKLFARTIAASFLLLAGVSLALAHSKEIRWQAFGRRFAMVAGTASLITIATYATTPDRFVFFGILHQVAAASIIALLFMRLNAIFIGVIGLLWLALPFYFRSDIFLSPAFWWVGLAPYDPASNDYVPVFPWTGFVITGLAIGKLILQSSWHAKLSAVQLTSGPTRALTFLGRNSLIYYLLHQPVMMAALYGLTQLVPPAPIDRSALFMPQCAASCQLERDVPFCQRFCTCVREELVRQSIFQEVLEGKRSVSSDPQVLDVAAQCTALSQE